VWAIFRVTAVKILKLHIYSKYVRATLFIPNVQSKVHSFYSLCSTNLTVIDTDIHINVVLYHILLVGFLATVN
jgi:hypothetical protein